MNVHRIRRSSLAPTLHGDELAHNTERFHLEHSGQTQISDPAGTWTLHLVGTPNQLRHLAFVIAEAAVDLETQIHEQAAPHYAAMAAEAQAMAKDQAQGYADDFRSDGAA